MSGRNAAEFAAGQDNVFARIAGRYDRLCDIFSLFIHRLWKRAMVRQIVAFPADTVLDLASGTGDIPLRLLRARNVPTGLRILVTDLCPEMLAIAQARIGSVSPQIDYRQLDAHDLSTLPDDSLDIVSMSFAMKICDRGQVLAEAFRVLRPGGRFFCLEAARIPWPPLHAAYLTYMRWCMPLIGRIAANGDRGAYEYLLKGIHDFPDQQTFAQELCRAGFQSVRYTNLTLGIVALHQGTKPE